MATDNAIKLLIETGQKTYVQVVKLSSRFPCVIGRQSPDILINDPMLSRKHCQLLLESGVLYVEDLGSSNGVEVNGSMIKRMRLRIDDHIRVGTTHIKVVGISLGPKKTSKVSF